MPEISCEECGKEKWKYPSWIKRSKIHFCSRLCQNRFYNRNHPEHQKKAGKLGGIKSQIVIKKKYGNKIAKLAYQKNLEKNPDLHRRGYSGLIKAHPNHFKQIQKDWKARDTIGYLKQRSKNGLKSIQIIRKNKPYWFAGVPFDSKSEMLIARYLVENKHIKLIEGKNCHVKVGGIEIDFLVNGTFLEYHPIIKGLYKQNAKEYYDSRRKILDEAGYQNNKLIILENQNSIKLIQY